MTIFKMIIQILTMLTDLFIVGAVLSATYYFGFVGLALAVFLAWGPTKDTGGLFYSWRPSSIRKFWNNI